MLNDLLAAKEMNFYCHNACVPTLSFIAGNLVSRFLLEMSDAGEGGQLVKIRLVFNFFQCILP